MLSFVLPYGIDKFFLLVPFEKHLIFVPCLIYVSPPRLDLRWYILPRRDEIHEISKYATNRYIIVIIIIIMIIIIIIMMMMMMMMMMIMITILMILIIIMKCWNLFIDTQRFFTGGQFNISFFCDYSQLIDKNSTRPLTMGHDSTGKERHCLLAVLIICGRTSLLELWSKNIQNLEINSISLHQRSPCAHSPKVWDIFTCCCSGTTD